MTTLSGDASPVRARDSSRALPPARRVERVLVTTDPVDVGELERLVADAAAGAVVSFAGVVRDHDGGRAVTMIEYEGHPSAQAVLEDVAADVAARTEVDALAVAHRVGPLQIGDAALVVAVSAAHRQEAFAAAALLVDEVKARLPVWKRQVFGDGTQEWVACP
ncbi:MAG TPA: molybdenum cofactor biosynthesis protein MoaE [Kineosporiaceae bacterium]|nr:molybdenum cofactor biosynthesis protein MoaE [Kineosporiaceae bacterium]